MDRQEKASFGEVLRRYRLAAGLTQEALAERARMSAEGISALERGTRQAPYRDTVRLLATALGLSAAGRADLEQTIVRARGGRDVRSRATPATSEDDAPSPGEGKPQALPEVIPPLRSLDSLPNNLPRQLTTFVGRERELADVRELLAAIPLVTLTGSGGCGKTRLALQVAADLVDAYADGVWLVELAPLSDPGLVAPTVASVLGVQRPDDRPILAHLVAALRARRLLLILDNCEHLVDASAGLADALLRGCPDVRILATSREALRIAGETSWRVPSLDVPPGDRLPPLADLGHVEAVHLFVDRASAARPGFALSGQNAAAIAEICRRLDGVPLALELAAARLQGLSTEQLAARLDQRFRLLIAGSRTALPRQQTLAATVAWSYDLLGDAERTLFARLAVFAGGFTLEAAETVCGDIPRAADDGLDLLLRLVDKSLVVAELSEQGVARYRLLETLRQFGWEKLAAAGGAESLGERHAGYFLAQAEEGERGLRGRDQVAWLWRLEADHDNLRAALNWLERRGRFDAALRLAGALAVFWAIRGHYAEGRAHLARLSARPETAESWAERGKALWGLGRLADRQGDAEVMRACFEESLVCATQAGDRETIIRSMVGLAKWAVWWNDRRAGQWLDDAMARARELGQPWAIAAVLAERVVLEGSQGDLALAQSYAEEKLALARQMGDTWEVDFGLHMLGSIVLDRGDDARARVLFDEMLAITKTLGDRSSIANTLLFLSQVDVVQGAPGPARTRFAEAIAIYRERGDHDGVAVAAGNLAELALSQGDLDAARAAAAECLTAARILGAEKLATALMCNGDVALAGGDIPAAERYFADALALLGPDGRPGPTSQVLQGFARVAAARAQPVRALRLAGRAAVLRGWNPHRPAFIDRALLERALRPLRDAPDGLGPDEQAAVWAEGEAMTAEQAAAYALSGEE